jgi:hypothetical protein
MAMTFYCYASATKSFVAPNDEELRQFGGIFTPGTSRTPFVLTNGKTAKSPSGACKACLNRDGDTNEWQGPNHVYLLLEGTWIRYNQTGFYGL